MNRMDRYLLKEALPLFAFGLFLYAALALLSNVLPRAEFLGTARLAQIGEWLALQLPSVITQMLPVSVLLSVMLTIGRLARENELLVMQAAGISLRQTTRIFFLGGLLLSGVSLALTEFVLPWSNKAAVLMYWNALVPERNAVFRLVGQDLEVGNYRLRFETYDRSSDSVQKVRLESWNGQQQTVVLAASARLQGNVIVFSGYKTFSIDFSQLPVPDYQTLEQLEQHLQSAFKSINVGKPGATLTVRLSLSRQDLEARYSGGGFAETTPLSQWWSKIRDPQTAPKERIVARASFHSGLALALANLMIVVLALPVAVERASSPGTALGLALVLTILYYTAAAVGKVVALSGAVAPELAAWAANLVGAAIGLWFGRRIYR